MATGDNSATFESWLNRATDPNNQTDRWDCIQGFYQLVNQETDGPQVAVRLLAHKIQSPQERESLQALTVLEACMNNCGKRFHGEAAKFRFLNELIKILTPKYFGSWTPQRVKERVTEVLYGWTLWLKDEPKIQEAYSMLKKQGIVKEDPKLPDALIITPPSQRAMESVFDQEDKANLLARLLKSGRPEDLETANRLIRSTVKEEQEKAEKALKRESTLKEVESSAMQLRELLHQHSITGASSPPSDDLKALYERCDRLRPTLFRLASDTMDDDAALTQVLAANDDLTLAVNAYRDRVGRRERSQSAEEEAKDKNSAPTSPREVKSYHLIDLSALDSPSPFESSSHVENAVHLAPDPDFTKRDNESLKPTQETSKSYLEELMQLTSDVPHGGRGAVLRARGCVASNGTSGWSLHQNQPLIEPGSTCDMRRTAPHAASAGTTCPQQLLTRVFVPMESIKSSQLEPITLYDHAGVHVSLHFAKDTPPGHPAVAVAVVSAVNTSALEVKDFVFQAAVPKTMLVKLQPASGTRLPPYNPLLPPPAISQVVLLANPHQGKVRLRYKLTMTHGGTQLDEGQEIDNFPDWNALIGH